MDTEKGSKLSEASLPNVHFEDELVLDEKIQILRCIGKGGLGAVYEAYHQLLQQKVAVKVLLEGASVGDLQRFRREAQASFSLSHENIACIRDFGVSSGGQEFIVMDFVDGESLASIVRNTGPIKEPAAIELSLQIARGLEHAHKHNVVHRDIKPSNIVVARAENPGSGGRVKIVDFGVAQLVHAQMQESNRLTRTGEVVGTPCYMSPEQALGEVTDHRADIYSFGCTLFEMLSGRTPFEGENHLAVMTQHLHKDAPTLDKSVCSQSLSVLIGRCMAKKTAERYQSFAEVIADLESINRGEPLKPVSTPVRIQSRTLWPVFGFVALISMVSWFTLSAVRPVAESPNAVSSEVGAAVNSKYESPYDASDLRGIALLNSGKVDEAKAQFEKAKLSAPTGSSKLLRSLQKLRIVAKLRKQDSEVKTLTNEISQVSRRVESSVKLNHAFIRERQETLELLPEKIPAEKHAKLISLASDINEVAHHLAEQRHYSQAETLLKLLLKKLEASFPNSDASISATYQTLSEICSLRGQLIEARQYSLAALSANTKVFGRNSLPVADSLIRRAEIEARLGNTKIAEASVREATTIVKQPSKGAAESVAKLLLDKAFVEAELAFQSGKTDTALALLSQCFEAYSKQGDKNKADKVLHKQLDILQLSNQFSKAESILLTLIDSSSLKNEGGLQLADWEMSLGDLYFRQPIVDGVTHKAREHFQRAMEIRQHVLSPDDTLVEDAILCVCSSGNVNIPALAAQVIAVHEMDGKETKNYVKAMQLFCATKASDTDPKVNALFNRSFDIILSHEYSDMIDQRFYDTALVLWTDAHQPSWSRLEKFLTAQVATSQKSDSVNSLPKAQAIANLSRFYLNRGQASRAYEELSLAYQIVSKLSATDLTAAERWDASGIVLEFAKASKFEGKSDWMSLLEESNSLRYARAKQ